MSDALKNRILELSEQKYSDGSKMYSRAKIASMVGSTVSQVRWLLGARAGEFQALKSDPERYDAYKAKMRLVMKRRRKAAKPQRKAAAARRVAAGLSALKPEHLTQAERAGLAKAIAAVGHESMVDAWFAGAKYLSARCKAQKAVKP